MKKENHLQYQFCIAVYVKAEYEKEGESASNLYSDWGGVEAPNSWKGCLTYAQDIVTKQPDYLCVVIDRMNRKKPSIVKL